MMVASAAVGDPQRPLRLIPKFLQHPHEFWVHIGGPTSTSACHLIDGEVWADHFSHEQPRSDEKGSALNKPTALQFPIRFQFFADFGNDFIINSGC